MSGGDDFEMKKLQLFNAIEEDKRLMDELSQMASKQNTHETIEVIKGQLHQIQVQIRWLEES